MSGGAGAREGTEKIELWPLLFVSDMERSLQFYHDLLGFAIVTRAPHAGSVVWCRLVRGRSSIMLQQATQEDGTAKGRGRGVGFYFVCDDADLMYEELSSRGVHLRPPTIAAYGMKQLHVPEPDGYAICFESRTAAYRD